MKRSLNSSSNPESKTKQQKLFSSKFDLIWKNHGDPIKDLYPLIYLDGPSVSSSTKIASFDLDDALITTKSRKKFPISESDWKFLSSKVVAKLKSLYNEGYKLVIFTNQAGIEKKKLKPQVIQTKIMDIIDELGIPMQVFISTGENIYRKPYINAWNFCVLQCNGTSVANLSESFYVGDAAGRPKDWAVGRKKDFSCSDRKFAKNIGIQFYTPEEFFDGAVPYLEFDWGSIDPVKALSDYSEHSFENICSNDVEMIIFVGSPAAGKSFFAKNYLEPKLYVIVNRDSLKTIEKCISLAEKSLKNKKSVVIDNTNPSKEARKVFIDLAKKYNVSVRCFNFQTPLELAHHLNRFRQIVSGGTIRRVPDVGFNTFKSKFQPPSKEEGFEIVTINFSPKFHTNEEKALFLQWT
ncbi:bifunctional polynucleotide phosphatase/kinase [Hydra vulgaris]|uniref:bifunctional polynucleotide phosphatase/kinase n=1 Tax=Hydra vulgaris TaxID=6087 RepID=UPI001F5FAB64|nr:bifunctional polynucleotide phosphatase/kinase-like [Hydra vulgaris]